MLATYMPQKGLSPICLRKVCHLYASERFVNNKPQKGLSPICLRKVCHLYASERFVTNKPQKGLPRKDLRGLPARTPETTHVSFASQCQTKQAACQNINSDKDRVVTLLDDGLQVMCDTKTDGGGWIIFQRRTNGNVSFYRGWEEYKYGFGDYYVGEFYLGNEFIHQLTSKRHYKMRADLKFNNKNYFASYSRFKIFGEPEKYRLHVSGYSGNATDNLISDL
ncbi:hypothetical protein Btru_059383 [Bulinus truncatus]|nr:hypothetical protein Btru_059383 [Bulinus truncatus]